MSSEDFTGRIVVIAMHWFGTQFETLLNNAKIKHKRNFTNCDVFVVNECDYPETRKCLDILQERTKNVRLKL